jgi:hypothetical protein
MVFLNTSSEPFCYPVDRMEVGESYGVVMHVPLGVAAGDTVCFYAKCYGIGVYYMEGVLEAWATLYAVVTKMMPEADWKAEANYNLLFGDEITQQ